MERAFLETIFLCGIALLALLQLYYFQNFEADRKILNAQKKKRLFLFLLFAGIQVIPFIYLFSIDFGSTDYHFWKWLTLPVALLFFFCIWLFVKALSDLGRWWVPGQELKEDLELVRTGAYRYVRHPMYLALLGVAVCQVFMIQHWIAGPVSLFLVTPFCLFQIRREERLLIRYFGDEYEDYCIKTGMLWPREDKMPIIRKLLRELYGRLISLLEIMFGFLSRLFRKKSPGSVDGSL